MKHSSNHAKLVDPMPWNRDIEYARRENPSIQTARGRERRKGDEEEEEELRQKGFSRRLASQSPSHDWCFHFSGVHHHRDKKCKPSTPTCKTQSLVESAFQEIGSGWRSRIKNSGAWGTADGIVHALEENPWIDNSFEWLLTIMGPPSRTK